MGIERLKKHCYLVVELYSLGNHGPQQLSFEGMTGMTDTAWLSASLFFTCFNWHVAQIDSNAIKKQSHAET